MAKIKELFIKLKRKMIEEEIAEDEFLKIMKEINNLLNGIRNDLSYTHGFYGTNRIVNKKKWKSSLEKMQILFNQSLRHIKEIEETANFIQERIDNLPKSFSRTALSFDDINTIKSIRTIYFEIRNCLQETVEMINIIDEIQKNRSDLNLTNTGFCRRLDDICSSLENAIEKIQKLKKLTLKSWKLEKQAQTA